MKKLLFAAGIFLSSTVAFANMGGLKDVICVYQRYGSEWTMGTYAFSLSAFTMSRGQSSNVVDFIMKDVPSGVRHAGLCLQLEGTSSPNVLRANAYRLDGETIQSFDRNCQAKGVDVRVINKGSKEISYGDSLQYETRWPSGANGAVRIVEYIVTPEEMDTLNERTASDICARFMPGR